MTSEELYEIKEKCDKKVLSNRSELMHRNCIKGLLILEKYLPNIDIEAAEHDIVYAADVDKALNAGLTKEDAELLFDMNWILSEDSFACFV